MTPATRLALPGTTNVRDLGGCPVGSEPGGVEQVVAPGRLLRGEVLGQPGNDALQGSWDPREAAAFAALRLRTVVDLRSDVEVERTPSAWTEATGAETLHIPIAEGGEGADTNFVRQLLSGERTGFTEGDLTAFYVDTLWHRASAFATVVRLAADPDRLPVLVHCSAGKDRTGLAIALVLELLGVPREVVVADYALTGVLRPDRVAAYAPRFREAGVDPDAVRVLFDTPAASMAAALARFDREYGGAATYLEQEAGVGRAVVLTLRRALLVPASGVAQVASWHGRSPTPPAATATATITGGGG